jgi:hypothetical protein
VGEELGSGEAVEDLGATGVGRLHARIAAAKERATRETASMVFILAE